MGSPGAAGCPAPARAPTPPETPVAALLRVLLDTTGTTSARAANVRLGLQAGPSLRAFYGLVPASAWLLSDEEGPAPAADSALALLAGAAAYGLQSGDYNTSRLRAGRDSLIHFRAAPGRAARLARFDLYLTDAVLRFQLDLCRGRLRSGAVSAHEKRAEQVFRPAEGLRAGLAGGRVRAAVLAAQPPNREYRRLQTALARRLAAAAPAAADSVARWRTQNETLTLNLERWRWDALADSEYVLINLPAFVLQVVRNGRVVQQHRVIVGKAQTPTPTLSSTITHFTTAPDWHVPRSIAIKEMLPHLRLDAGYLDLNGLALFDLKGRQLDPAKINWQQVKAENFAYTIRQAPGCDNALGNVVFRFANPYAIYLHDTPMRQFFAQPARALSSHGCIRLEKPLVLAAYLLRREGRTAHLPTEDECARQPRSRTFWLRRPLPLHVRYATCGVDESGTVRFYGDPYGRDAAVRRAAE